MSRETVKDEAKPGLYIGNAVTLKINPVTTIITSSGDKAEMTRYEFLGPRGSEKGTVFANQVGHEPLLKRINDLDMKGPFSIKTPEPDA